MITDFGKFVGDLLGYVALKRGTGKGKEGKKITALARGRIFCPSCKRLMSIYRDSKQDNLTYYVCRSRSHGWKRQRCRILSLRIDCIDNAVWDCLYALLKQPEWVNQELSKQKDGKNIADLRKRIRFEEKSIRHIQYRINRIQEGYETDPPIYSADEVKEKIGAYRDRIAIAQAEKHRLQRMDGSKSYK